MSDKNLNQIKSEKIAPSLHDAADQEVKMSSSRMSRTALATKNAAFGLAGQVINLLVSFASRTVFIYLLGEY